MGSELSFGKTLCILQSANLWTRYFLAFRRLGCPGPAKRSLSVSAISQNRPAIIEIKGLKTATLRKAKQLRVTVKETVQWGMSNVLKVSLQTTIYSFSRSRVVSAPDCTRTWHKSRDVGRYLCLAQKAKPGISTTGLGSENHSLPKRLPSI